MFEYLSNYGCARLLTDKKKLPQDHFKRNTGKTSKNNTLHTGSKHKTVVSISMDIFGYHGALVRALKLSYLTYSRGGRTAKTRLVPTSLYTQTPYFSERRDVKLLDYSEKIYSKLPYSLHK